MQFHAARNQAMQFHAARNQTNQWRHRNETVTDTAFCHFQNLTRKCLLGIRGKSTAGVILPLGESVCLDWSIDKWTIYLDWRKVLVT